MTNPLKKVQAGQPLNVPAEAFNAFIDAAQFAREHRNRRDQQAEPTFRQSGIVRVKNNSGADRGRFEVLGVDGSLLVPSTDLAAFKNHLTLTGVAPTESDHVGRFVVLLEPIADGAIGRAYASGVFPVQLNVVDPNHEYADVHDGVTTDLQTREYGAARILWKDTSSNWAIVRLGTGAECGAVTCPKAFACVTDFSQITGYDGAMRQALIHDQGCLEWLTIGTC